MDSVDRFLQTFNEGKVPALATELATPDYTFGEPLYPGPYDAAGHEELMAQVVDSYPDRRIDVHRRRPGSDGVVVEGVWSGAPAQGGERLELPLVAVFDIDADSGRLRRMRTYYEPFD